MSGLPDLSNKEPSTEALLEESRSPGTSIKGSFSDQYTELASGARFDRNKLPDQLAWDKTRTEKVQVMENTPPKMVDKVRNPTGLN